MKNRERPLGFWVLEVFIALSIILMLLGQTMSVFDYDFTVRYGLQESAEQVSEFGVQVNRAFGASDTVVYVPLLIASLFGLWHRKQWALVTTAAVGGISLYWSTTIIFMFLFLPDTKGYDYLPGVEIWSFVIAFAVFGVWSIWYLISHKRELFESN
ncbi:hypothetical protein L4D76_19260 [Photobacterium sagamiensis]|uniref:hypothetical protein n=1 Tax=Photobacterium sagamiensis TaxID=2910241 RepID=UPI003D1535C0